MATTQPRPLHWSPEDWAAVVEAAKRPSAPLLWPPTVAAQRLGISRAKLYELMASGQLASLKIGSRRLIPDDELRRFIATRLAENAEW